MPMSDEEIITRLGLKPGGAWTLFGATMEPGLVWEDFDLGKRDQLISVDPLHKHLIMGLTREHD